MRIVPQNESVYKNLTQLLYTLASCAQSFVQAVCSLEVDVLEADDSRFQPFLDRFYHL